MGLPLALLFVRDRAVPGLPISRRSSLRWEWSALVITGTIAACAGCPTAAAVVIDRVTASGVVDQGLDDAGVVSVMVACFLACR